MLQAAGGHLSVVRGELEGLTLLGQHVFLLREPCKDHAQRRRISDGNVLLIVCQLFSAVSIL